MRRPCQHCHTYPISRPRRLCWRCYHQPDIKDMYQPTTKHGNRGLGNHNQRVPLPPCPTDAQPGSEAKVRVLEERAKADVALFHPLDY